MTADITKSDIASAALRVFPPLIRQTLLDDREFRSRFGIPTVAILAFNGTDSTFSRADLFDSVRAVFDEQHAVAILSQDGLSWNVDCQIDDNCRLIVLSRESTRIDLPEFWPLSSNAEERIRAFEKYAFDCNFRDDEYAMWREVIATRSVTDEEFNELHMAMRTTPQVMSSFVLEEIRSGTSKVSSLVPDSARYFDRLVGDGNDATELIEYIEKIVKPHISRLLDWHEANGLRYALFISAHPYLPKAIPVERIKSETVLRLLDWLEKKGDRHSQLAAIEFGFEHLDRFPDIEPKLVRLIEQFRRDDPEDENGRLKLLSSLVVLVEGELARTQSFRRRPPFWRRLASIAQASLLECSFAQIANQFTNITDFALRRCWHIFYMQTLVDLRSEPRWLPDSIVPSQLKAEFLGRIAGAATVNEQKIKSTELRDLVLGDGAQGIRKLLVFPQYFHPGPLEGAAHSYVELPEEFKRAVETELASDTLKVNSFAGLVNLALVFRIGPELVQLTSTALQRVKYELRNEGPQDQSFELLTGLATVAAVTRSTDLANQVRILTRVLRRRTDVEINPPDTLRICMIAAASYQELEPWCTFVGEWLTELTFEPLERRAAETLLFDIELLCQIQPSLWRTCGRAQAACKGLVER
jgi:hypothetical protein